MLEFNNQPIKPPKMTTMKIRTSRRNKLKRIAPKVGFKTLEELTEHMANYTIEYYNKHKTIPSQVN